MDGEIGRVHGVVYVDDGKPLPPFDPSRCPACGRGRVEGTWWVDTLLTPNGGITRWKCPCGFAWIA